MYTSSAYGLQEDIMSPAANRLIVRTGPNPGMVFDLTKEIATLGRDVASDIVLGDPEVSRQHARLTRTPGGYVLEDLGSTNGTFINGERLSAPRVLRPGDLLALSEKVTLTFESSVPVSAETVISPAEGAERYAPTMREEAPAQPPLRLDAGQPVPTPRAKPVSSAKSRIRSPWFIAGCGCLIVLAVVIAFLVIMDKYYPDILYAPFRLLGF
jgi:pSer/pThr/pTyr-binding forkhead associated (FHA) protein